MSLLNSLETWYFGVDPEAEQARGQAADAVLQQQAKDRLDEGIWTPEQYAKATADLNSTATGDVQGQIDQAAAEGAKEGLKNLGSEIQAGTNFSFGALFKLIPWQAWVLGVILLFAWLGGFDWLKGILARKK